MKKYQRIRFGLVSLLLTTLVACVGATPYKVVFQINRGEVQTASVLLAELLNENRIKVDNAKLEHMLKLFGASRKYTLDLADEFFKNLNPKSKDRVLAWYANEYLKLSERAVDQAKFDQARKLWQRYQKIRRTFYPKLTEITPILGIIELREAEYLARKKKMPQAHARFASARKQLSKKSEFDLIQQDTFKTVVKDVKKLLVVKPTGQKGK